MSPFLFRVALGAVTFATSCSIWAISGDAHAARPTLTANGDSRAGHVTLQWEVQDATSETAERVYELQESPTADFHAPRVRYQGPQTSSVLSGIPDGTQFFRVREKPANGTSGGWSDPVRFEVKHHSLATAAGLMALGAIVFVVTAWFVTKGEDLAGE
jgi:hypothetical protein